MDENAEIKEQLAQLNGGSLEGLEMEEVTVEQDGGGDSPPVNGDGNSDAPVQNKEKGSNKKTKVSSANPNAEKIQALLEKYNSNIGMLSSMQSELINVQTDQQIQVQEGEQIQSQSEQKHGEIVKNTQTEGQNSFQKIGDAISNSAKIPQRCFSVWPKEARINGNEGKTALYRGALNSQVAPIVMVK